MVPRNYPPEIAAKAKAGGRRALGHLPQGARGWACKIAFGTDSGVSPHGKNALEFALLVDHGMTPAAALRTATSSAARPARASRRGSARSSPARRRTWSPCPATLSTDIRAMERVTFVMKGGQVAKR